MSIIMPIIPANGLNGLDSRCLRKRDQIRNLQEIEIINTSFKTGFLQEIHTCVGALEIDIFEVRVRDKRV